MADTCKVEECGYCHYNAETGMYECLFAGTETSEYEECERRENNESV
jgi:hypothetical protein